MSGRQDKKLRQLYRRDFRQEVVKEAQEYAAHFKKRIRQKPWYIPRPLWVRIVRLVIEL